MQSTIDNVERQAMTQHASCEHRRRHRLRQQNEKPPICFLSQIGGFMSIPLEEFLAEREGFEPSVRLPVQRFSRPSRSTTPASFLKPSAKLRLFSEKHHFYPIFFNQKVGQAEKRARFTLSTNHQQIVKRQTLFPHRCFKWQDSESTPVGLLAGHPAKKDRVIPTRFFLSCQVDYYFSLSSIVQMLTRFQSGSENMSPTPLP